MGSGGEGDIYAVLDNPEQVVKVYKKFAISQDLEEKIKFMVRRPLSESVLNWVAWPIDMVYDPAGSFCGFVMPKLYITHELNDVYVYPPRIGITYKQKLILAQNICVVIHELHKVGYVLGDFNPRNIGVNLNSGAVAFLDTDSYHIVIDKASNRAYRCNVCAPGYAAPELLKKCVDYISAHPEDKRQAYAKTPLDTFTKETDNFALAVHMFRLLMNGYTPFNGIPEDQSPSEGSPGQGDAAVRRDSYCFKPGNKPQATAVPEFDSLPQKIQEFFSRAFIDGRNDPTRRPSSREWYKTLGDFEKELVICKKNPVHMYHKELNNCPCCEAENRYSALMSPKIEIMDMQNENISKEKRMIQSPCDGFDYIKWLSDEAIEKLNAIVLEARDIEDEEELNAKQDLLYQILLENMKEHLLEICPYKDNEAYLSWQIKKYMRTSSNKKFYIFNDWGATESYYFASIWGCLCIFEYGEDYRIDDVIWYEDECGVAITFSYIPYEEIIVNSFCYMDKENGIVHRFPRSKRIVEKYPTPSTNKKVDLDSCDDWM